MFGCIMLDLRSRRCSLVFVVRHGWVGNDFHGRVGDDVHLFHARAVFGWIDRRENIS